MSEKIYFSNPKKFSVKRSVVNLITRLHYSIAPDHARKVARKLLLTPSRIAAKNTKPTGLHIGQVDSSEGALTTYQLGEGPVWVLTHGWSGSSSQFFPLMEYIASQGYTALAYDHPAHGDSGGLYGHMPAFIIGLEAILDSVDEVAGLVGHSMGTAAALECHHTKLVDKPFLLIAPVLNYVENLLSSVARSGYSLKLFNSVVDEIADQYRYPVQAVDPFTKLGRRTVKTIIVHDKNDKFADYSISHKASQKMERVCLVTTQGQGHGRIMKSAPVKESFDQLTMAQENIND
jgi:pimeloyl-ACP methyl ester carboxylesterase